MTGPLVVGRVLDKTDEPQKNGKTVHFCHVDIGREQPQEIVCGAHNFAAGDLVAVILPGGRLGDIEIAARKTYGHVSAGFQEIEDNGAPSRAQAGTSAPGASLAILTGRAWIVSSQNWWPVLTAPPRPRAGRRPRAAPAPGSGTARRRPRCPW